MPRRQGFNEQIGEARWRALRCSRVYLKFILMILPVVAAGLSVSFNKVAYIHQRNDTGWFNLTVKFPFHHDRSTIVYTNETTPPNIEFDKDIEICSWLFMGVNAAWFVLASAILLTYILVHGGDQMEPAATVDGFISCSMSLIGATITSLWLYNILNLRKTVIGAIDYVYNGPSQCLNDNICEKSVPNFLLLYIASGIGFLASVIWGVSIITALKYSFGARKGGGSGAGTGILEMSNEQRRDLHL